MEIDFNWVVKEFSEPFPKWYRKRMFKVATETKKDPLWLLKHSTELLLAQYGIVTLQALFFFIFVSVIAAELQNNPVQKPIDKTSAETQK